MNRQWTRNTPHRARCQLAGRSTIQTLSLIRIGFWRCYPHSHFRSIRLPPSSKPSVPSRPPTQSTTPKASQLDGMMKIESTDLAQSGSRSFYVTSSDLHQELMERSKSVNHPLQLSSFAAPSSEKSNLRNSISTTTTDRADGFSALGCAAPHSANHLSSQPTFTRKI
ncbi:hypothetical protein BLNAU_11254 [Blattamonas nauphoetae]|uniref:Uncharacterized protein n=1 Tax=Blattamonas nauphoetae TaxID=2049346 RepID=A0ABQ9XP89_9EUKA|nr:hypothetical protein BLNAU_11254 [Blattamonas nauphoetae]